MLNEKIQAALNQQINQEMSAAYGYLAMAAHFDTKNLSGFASWMLTQHSEELDHAMRLYRYVLDRGGEVELDAIEKPQGQFESVRSVFDAARTIATSGVFGSSACTAFFASSRRAPSSATLAASARARGYNPE